MSSGKVFTQGFVFSRTKSYLTSVRQYVYQENLLKTNIDMYIVEDAAEGDEPPIRIEHKIRPNPRVKPEPR